MPRQHWVKFTFSSLDSKSWLLGHVKKHVSNIKVKWSLLKSLLKFIPCFRLLHVWRFLPFRNGLSTMGVNLGSIWTKGGGLNTSPASLIISYNTGQAWPWAPSSSFSSENAVPTEPTSQGRQSRGPSQTLQVRERPTEGNALLSKRPRVSLWLLPLGLCLFPGGR